jgi:hypothetical protein
MNGWKNNSFWDNLCEDYNKNTLPCDIERLAILLEIKWGCANT